MHIWLLYHDVQTNQTCQKIQKCKLVIIITYIHYKIEHICKKNTQKKKAIFSHLGISSNTLSAFQNTSTISVNSTSNSTTLYLNLL